jgi:hypothetical protein
MKQHMSVRNKQHRGPQSPRVSSRKQRAHAKQVGFNAWMKYGKSITENPYRGLEGEAWREGYLLACQFKGTPIEERAPLGLPRHKDSYVVVKLSHPKRKFREAQPRSDKGPELYLGYIKPGKNGRPKRFFVWSNNPKPDEWRNKIANKSYKEPKDVENTLAFDPKE